MRLRNYQDDLDTNNDVTDPVMHEVGEDITEELGVDPKEFKKELDNYDFDEAGHGDDDRREQIEDLDQENDEDTSN